MIVTILMSGENEMEGGYYNYNQLINKYGDPSTMPWIDGVYTSKITENANKNNTN